VDAKPYRLSRRRYFPLIFMALSAGAAATLLLFLPLQRAVELMVPTTAASAGLVYFLYSQHLQQTRLFVELFREFNARYDKLNERLNLICAQSAHNMIEPMQKQVLFDYFNLCAEEWMYYKAGYIDPDVWAAWREGMRYFLQSSDIRRLWVDELDRGSYYGLTIAEIDRHHLSSRADGEYGFASCGKPS
jgi:hypothetical protein